MSADPVLHLLIGPNGSGKSTLWYSRLQPVLGEDLPFVNADEIARSKWPDDPDAHAIDAGVDAERIRSEFIRHRLSFAAETVSSHPSKLEFVDDAVDAGYLVTLHVLFVDPDTAVARVRHRVDLNGHPVDEETIRKRHPKIWPIAATMIDRVATAIVYDNRSGSDSHREVARFEHGRPVIVDWPAGFPDELTAMTEEN